MVRYWVLPPIVPKDSAVGTVLSAYHLWYVGQMEISTNRGPIRRWTYLDLLIAAGIILFGLHRLMASADPGGTAKRAIIYQDEAVLETISLGTGQARSVDLSRHGIAMVVAVRQGRVRVASSTCNQQICVRKGWTGQVHDPIICIPNRVTIYVTGTDPAYDAISR